jgi:hypothetical protein
MTEAPEPAEEIVRAQPTCANCDAPMHGEFCAQCGQPKKGMIRHLTGILADFLDSVFNLDSRTFRTVGPLFYKPGYLSNEYFAGRRTRYVTPLRLYVFLSVIAFLAVSMTTKVSEGEDQDGLKVGLTMGEKPEDLLAELDAEEKENLERLEKLRSSVPADAFERMLAGSKNAFEAKRRSLQRRIDTKDKPGPAPGDLPDKDEVLEVTPDNPNPMRMQIGGKEPWHPVTNPLRISWAGETFNTWLNSKVGLIAANGVEAQKHPGKFVATLFSVAPQALLLILPLFALLLKIFFLFKKRLYMEHLIVALHSHSFLCLSILVLVILGALRGWVEAWPIVPGLFTFLIFATSCWIPIYLLIAQKRIYHQGWLMTSVKYFCIGMCYTVLLSFGILLNLFWALATL